MFAIRKCYYRLVKRLSEVELTNNFYGFGLYDRRVIEILRTIDDPYPYFRGLIAEHRLPAGQDRVHAAAPRARHHQEQLLHALRHGHAGHHQPLEGAAAAGHHAPVSAWPA